MKKSQSDFSRINKVTAFVDYKPAELRINKQWLIVYYVKNPLTKELDRKRLSVPVVKSKNERLKLAKKITLNINLKLEAGWNPYYTSEVSNDFKTIDFCFNTFITHIEFEVKNKVMREDSLRSYKSYISMIKLFIEEKKYEVKLLVELNKAFFVNYLEWIYFERKNTASTYNNHLTFIINFVNYCVSKDWLKENFVNSIPRKKKQPKKRQVLSESIKEKVKKIEDFDKHYFTLCMLTYFCFIRRTELTKIKVRDVNLYGGYINVLSENSKNTKTESVTIPNGFLPIISDHLKDADINDYLFGSGDFKPSKNQLNPKKVSDTWAKYRKILAIPSEYQFYSLKDTGITDLLNTGIPAIKVRDQARHYDLRITETYTSRNITSDEIVKNSSFNF